MTKKKNKPGRKPAREAVFQPQFREDLRYGVETERPVAGRAVELIEAMRRDPFTGIGKPAPLKYLGPDVWPRRRTQEPRLVCRVNGHRMDVLQAR